MIVMISVWQVPHLNAESIISITVYQLPEFIPTGENAFSCDGRTHHAVIGDIIGALNLASLDYHVEVAPLEELKMISL